MADQKETYLGDGLYASFDGYMIILRAPRENGDHWVALEPLVYQELRRYAQYCWGPKEKPPTMAGG